MSTESHTGSVPQGSSAGLLGIGPSTHGSFGLGLRDGRLDRVNTELEIDRRIAAFVAGAQEIINDHFAANYSTLTPTKLTAERGPERYTRIVATRDGRSGGAERSVWAFIDQATGDVLQPAGWKEPAGGARGNVFDEDAGLTGVTPYGPPYLR